MNSAALIVAAGTGSRASKGNDATSLPKQFVTVGGKTILEWAIAAFDGHPLIKTVQVVCHADFVEETLSVTNKFEKCNDPVIGDITRQKSVFAGLIAMENAAPDTVLIHDAARPFVPQEVISRVLEGLTQAEAVLPVVAVVDTIKSVDPSGFVAGTPDRSALRAAQTPQGFHFQPLIGAHRKAAQGNLSHTDDASIMECEGYGVLTVDGAVESFKITTHDDFERAEVFLNGTRLCAADQNGQDQMITRTGIGFDVHAFVDGDAVILGSVAIPHNKRLSGHSDADVLLHTITDALYGAMADGDIGSHFPPSDPQWKGAASDIFLKHAVSRLADRGGVIDHVDAVIMCEAPKIGPHRDAIRASVAQIMDLTLDRVAIKATTTERLGFTGRKEGIAAQAVVTIRMPDTNREPQ